MDRALACLHGEGIFSRVQLALRPNVPVERHGFDPEFSAEFGHGGVAVGHCSLAQPLTGYQAHQGNQTDGIVRGNRA